MKKKLLLFGLGWILFNCFLGMLIGALYGTTMQNLHSAAAQGDMSQFWTILRDWNSFKSNHAHGMGFGIIAVIIALIWDEMNLTEKTKKDIGVAIMAGTVIQGIFNYLIRNIPMMVMGDILIVGAVLASLVGVFRSGREKQ